jgi:putative hydrolase of the HAD superfamily
VKLDAVIFDYGMVLSGPPNPELREELVRRSGMPQAQAETLYWKYRHAYDRGDLDGLTYWQTILEEGGVPSSPALIRELAELDARMWTGSNDPLVAWQASLRAAGIKTAILSNLGDIVQQSVSRNLPWTQNFDAHIFSYQLRIAKPDPAIYRHALQLLNSKAEETIFLDDITANVEAAQALGMTGILYTGIPALRHSLQSLSLDVFVPLPA